MDTRAIVLDNLAEELYTKMVGIQTEERFMNALLEGPMPAYYCGVRKSTLYEDQICGVDFYVSTDVGEAPFQIKTSYVAESMAKYFNRGIILMTVPPTVSFRIIRADAVRHLDVWRERRTARMKRWRPVWSSIVTRF